MTRNLLFFLLGLGFFAASAQELPSRRAIKKDVQAWQRDQNQHMSTLGESPLDSAALAQFKRLPFYPINYGAYQAVKWERCADSAWFEMPTTTARKPIYRKFATLYFTHSDGQTYSLIAYQSQALLDKEEYENYLFVPFGDATNGSTHMGVAAMWKSREVNGFWTSIRPTIPTVPIRGATPAPKCPSRTSSPFPSWRAPSMRDSIKNG
jgi:hypothetical protein